MAETFACVGTLRPSLTVAPRCLVPLVLDVASRQSASRGGRRQRVLIPGGAARAVTAAVVAAAAATATHSRRGRRGPPEAATSNDLRGVVGPAPFRESVELISRSLKVDQQEAWRLADRLQRYAVETEGEDPKGSHTKRLARRLVRGLEQHPEVRSKLSGTQGDVIKTLEELQRRSDSHTSHLSTIQQQHQDVKEGLEGDRTAYSVAAAYMAEEWWVRAVHGRIAGWIDQYFLLTPEQMRRGHHPWAFKNGGLPAGWKKYAVGTKVMFWDPVAKRMQRECPEIQVRDPEAAPPPREPPVALLDIGSCTNPFSRFPYLVETVALDLQPCEDNEDVLQGDFFTLPLVDLPLASDGTQVKAGRLVIGEGGKLEGIVKGSFDVVVLSLVLSYVSDPQKRAEMVWRARQCLRDDRGLLFIVEVKSALADASWYDGDAAAEWSKAIEASGFRTMRFEDSIRERRRGTYRENTVFQWIFETAPVSVVPGAPLMMPREMPW